ncbi:MAG TPA: hypothetical protein VMW66_01840 [Elusimicrobiales bacterium]|nr:hypothetical protein [Elusimicrobiales bacterium]
MKKIIIALCMFAITSPSVTVMASPLPALVAMEQVIKKQIEEAKEQEQLNKKLWYMCSMGDLSDVEKNVPFGTKK